MSEKFEDQGLVPDECTSEESKLTKRKITYTRECLLSLHDWETCCDLPNDFDSSLLQEFYDDGSNGILAHPSTERNMSMYSSDDSKYALPQPFKWNDEVSQEKFTMWDGDSSWLKNKDSSNSERNSNTDNISHGSSAKLTGNSSGTKNKDGHSTSNPDSDYERSCAERQVSRNPDKDGIQATPALPGVSESTAAVPPPVVQELYQLKKCANPYRPPHTYKNKNDKVKDSLNSGKDSPATPSPNEQQNENQSANQPPDSEQKSENEAINKSEVCVEQENKFSHHGDDKVTGGRNFDQDQEGVVIKELLDCAIEVKSSISAILSKSKKGKVKDTLNYGKDSPVTPSSNEQQNEKQSAKQPPDSEQKGESGRMNNNTVNILSSEEVSDNLIVFVLSSSEAINKSEVFVDQENKFSYHGDDKVTEGQKFEHDHQGVVLKELPDCGAEVKSSIFANLSKNVEANITLGSSLHHNKLTSSCTEVEKRSIGGSGPTDKPMASRLPTTETRGVLMSSNEQTILSNGNESSSTQNDPAKEHNDYAIEYDQLNSADSAASSERDMGFPRSPHFNEMESNQHTRGTEALITTSGLSFLIESRPHEPPFSLQIGSFNPNAAGQIGSESYGTQFPDVNDDFLLSVLDDSGAFEKGGDCFLFSVLDDSGAFEMTGALIKAIKVFMEAEEIIHEDENSVHRYMRDKMSSMMRTEQGTTSSPLLLSDGAVDSNTTSFLPTEEELYHSLSPNLVETTDFNELCLPDEDSLITVDDLIAPLSLEPLNKNSNVHVSPTAEVHTQDSRSHLLSSGEDYTASPYILPQNNIPPNPNGYENTTVYYSVLDQPGNLVQQTELHEGATFPDPMNQLGCYNDEARTTYFYPLNFLQPSYQGLGMPNPDGNNNQVRVMDHWG